MKNHTFRHSCLSLALIMLVFNNVAKAQTYLTDVYKPTDSYLYDAYPSKGDATMAIGRYPYKGGFTIRTGKSNILIATDKPGYAVFHLKGAYEKMSFVMGPARQIGESETVIVTIKGDGQFLLDEVMTSHDAPKAFTVDVHGVDELRFSLPRGTVDVAFGELKLWKAGQNPVAPSDPLGKIAVAKNKLVERIYPYYQNGRVAVIRSKQVEDDATDASISINRVEYHSGLKFTATQALVGHTEGCAYFWLQKKYDKVSFVVGPRDNQSSRATAWLTVKADGKIIYEKLVKQTDLAEQVVLDVKNVNQLGFFSIDDDHEFKGGIVFGVVDIMVYPAGDNTVPQPGLANASAEKIAKLPDVCKMCSNIPPYSVRGVSSYSNTYFDGASSHYHFSMGGEQFSEGFILTTGTTLFDDNINSYVAFDLAGQYDWVSFTAGCITKHRVLDDDIIRVYADDQMILETTIHATWPNQHFELPINKCRVLKFVKPGNGESKQVYFGIGDVVLYRGQPVPNNLFVHPKPECPETVDLIDLTHGPYFHYVGRYLSSLTNFDFNDCFKNGESKKEFFQMKDGSKIYKGIMLETNIPLGLEDITLSQALFMFLTSAGGAISSSNVSAFTGVTAGVGGLAGGMGVLSLVDNGGGQSSVAAFNPYREYESLTFTVANKSEYVDPFSEIVGGEHQAPPVKLDIFADQVKVAEIMLNDKMPPTTYTVPIYKCEQLMFWLECGDVRSGQYVLYDMTLSKKPYVNTNPQNNPEPPANQVENATPATKNTSSTSNTSNNSPESDKKHTKGKKEKQKKEVETINWVMPKLSGNRYIDDFLKDCNEVWKATQNFEKKQGTAYTLSTTYLSCDDGNVYKAVSCVDSRSQRLSIDALIAENERIISDGESIKSSIAVKVLGMANASLALPELGLNAITYGKIIRQGNQMLSQCKERVNNSIKEKEDQVSELKDMRSKALKIGDKESTDKVLFLNLDADETVPQGVLQQIRYFDLR